MNTAHPDFDRIKQAEAHEKAIVIGSGFGGLASAIRLAAKGYHVTLLEKLDALGGRGYTYKQDGFTFDGGPTIVTVPELFEELWELCGKTMSDDVDLRLMDPFYRIRFDDGRIFDYSNEKSENLRQILEFNPADAEGYERYLKASEARHKVGFALLDKPFSTLSQLLRFAPDLVRLRGDQSVYQLVSKYIKNEQLRQAVSFHPLLIGGNPYTASSLYSLISHLEVTGGVWSAMGGTGRIIESLGHLIRGQGSDIRLNAEVDQITTENRKVTGVRMKSGEHIAANLVISNADSAWTYKYLLSETTKRKWTERKIDKAHYSNGLFVWYFGTKKTYPDIPHHSIILGPRYKGLLTDIFKHKKPTTDFSLYLHRPTATDPSMAPEGCDAFYALVPVPHLDSGTDWATHAEVFRRAVEKRLEETGLPGLGDNLATSLMLTPLDFQNRLNSVKGAGFSLEPRITQSAYFRPHNKSEEVDGLYLVGAGTHPGAGMPAVLSSAKVVDNLIEAPAYASH
jgi:phytoene desaturase